MTDGETRAARTFPLTTHIKHTTQCAQHTHLCVPSIAPRQDHTQHQINTRSIPLWAPPSHLSQTTLNVFVQDGRRRQTKTCVEKGFSDKHIGIQKSILKSVPNQVTTKNQNLKRIDIGSLTSVKMVIYFGSELIQRLSVIRVTTTGHNTNVRPINTRISKPSF
jgi:hypothetical protein